MARPKLVRWPWLFMLAAAFLIQFTVPLIRLASTYKAIAIGVDPNLVGLLAAAFAVLPLFLVLWFGRLNDRHGVKPATLVGAAVVLVATPLLWFSPPSLVVLLLGTAVLGLGQTLLFSGLQMVIPLVSTRMHRDAVLGHYLVATSLGGACGPLMIGLAGTDEPAGIANALFALSSGSAALLLLCAACVCLSLRAHRRTGTELPSIGDTARTPGIMSIVIAGSLCATVQDLMLTYLPVLGLSRGISASTVGMMLAVVSLASVLSRASYGLLSRRMGRERLAGVAAIVAATGLASLALPLPVGLSFLALPLIGFGLGSTGTATLAILVLIAPRGARGTAMAMRQMGNRAGLFATPFGVGVVALSAGTAGVFLALSSLAALSGYLSARRLPSS